MQAIEDTMSYIEINVPYVDEPDCIEWDLFMKKESFLALVARATECRRQEEDDVDDHDDSDDEEEHQPPLVFNMDGTFINRYMALDETSAEQVTNALARAPISDLHLSGIKVPVTRLTRASIRSLTQWNQLSSTLESIESIDTVYCFVEDGNANSILCHLMPRLQYVTSLYVWARQSSHPRHISEVATLVAGLEANARLKLLVLRVPSRFYTAVLPALQCKPAIEMVCLESPEFHYDRMETATRDQAQAMADFMMRDLPIAVEFHGYNFSEDDCSAIICNGIAASGVQGFGLEGCFLGEDLTLLARSLAQSRLQSLNLQVSQDMLISLLHLLGPRIASMSQLQEFVCGQPSVGVYDSEVLNDLVVRLVEGLAQCSQLKVVKFTATAMTSNLEQALVELISKKNSVLQELMIDCNGIHRSATRHDCAALFDAIKSNYSIRKIDLVSNGDHVWGLKSPWSNGLRENIKCIMRLNNAGRNYMVADPYNKQKGFVLLEETNYSMNCLFLHLTDNPSLCERGMATDPQANVAKLDPRKRASSLAHVSDGSKRIK